MYQDFGVAGEESLAVEEEAAGEWEEDSECGDGILILVVCIQEEECHHILIQIINTSNFEGGIIMPGGDRTGPAGLGPMTGRAAGYCAGYSVPGYMNPIQGRGGFGRGFGWFGGGRGRGFRHMYWATGLPGWARYPGWGAGYSPYIPYGQAAIPPDQEAEALKNQAKYLEDSLNALNERIHELEKIEADKEKPKK
jgi:hypothetical protein